MRDGVRLAQEIGYSVDDWDKDDLGFLNDRPKFAKIDMDELVKLAMRRGIQLEDDVQV
jgi:hypothetical protein